MYAHYLFAALLMSRLVKAVYEQVGVQKGEDDFNRILATSSRCYRVERIFLRGAESVLCWNLREHAVDRRVATLIGSRRAAYAMW